MKRVLMSMQEEAQARVQINPATLEKVTKTLQPKMVKDGKERKEVELTEEERTALNHYASAKMYVDWAKSSESNQKIHGAVEQAKSEPGISIAKTALDGNKLVCNVLNGAFAFDQKTGETKFRKHLREDYCTKMMPVIYDSNAACPRFHKFIEWMFPDAEVRKFLQTYFGLCLTGLVVRKALRGSSEKRLRAE
jgi:phage/plasmid-associated DNA primase